MQLVGNIVAQLLFTDVHVDSRCTVVDSVRTRTFGVWFALYCFLHKHIITVTRHVCYLVCQLQGWL